MDTLLLASGMLLAYQYAHRQKRRQGVQDVEATSEMDGNKVQSSTRSNVDHAVGDDEHVRHDGNQYLDKNLYYRHAVEHKKPVPEFAPYYRGPRTVNNPVQQEMINEFRAERPATLSMGAIGNTAYRPSWMRSDDMLQSRQEREQALSKETPRMPDGRIDGFYDRYRTGSLNTIGRFGQGGLPFADQERVIPDGLHPVAANRRPTNRFHSYALGDDLAQTDPEKGLMSGLAQGQARGQEMRQETWDIMPTRQLQLSTGSQQMAALGKPLGAGVRSTGRGAPLGALLGSFPTEAEDSELDQRLGIERDVGPTGNKFPIQGGIKRREGRFDVVEDVDTEHVGLTASKSMPSRQRGPVTTGKEAWKFSFDLKKLMDLTTNTRLVKATTPTKIGAVTAEHRQDKAVGTIAAANKLPQTNDTFDAMMKETIVPEKVGAITADQRQEKAIGTLAAAEKRPLPSNTYETMIKETTAPEKIGAISSEHRQDKLVGTLSAASKRPTSDAHPKTKGTALYGGWTTFKGDGVLKKAAVSSTAIRSTKRQGTEAAAPLGKNSAGKSILIKKSDVVAKRSAVDDGMLKGNDEILHRAAIIAEPRRAPKGTLPDYAQPTTGTMRNPGEFRRRR